MSLRLLLIGFGTVGQGLTELVLEKKNEIAADGGPELSVVGIADFLKGSLYNPNGLDLVAALERAKAGEPLADSEDGWPDDALALIHTAEADMMVEATYTDLETGEPATAHIRAALERGLHVTTTNKGPVALHLEELTELARDHQVDFFYEGTVMSGTPVLNLARETLAGSRIGEVKGILNGTTNFILTRMENGLDYDTALTEAKEKGYAEAVPDADVLGHDALAKVTILANAVFGVPATPDQFPCEGITGITPEMIRDAAERGRRFKLIGQLRRDGDQVHGKVGPEEVALDHPLAGVSGATNALTFTTDTLGEVTVVGPGAGRRETGYSCLIDVLSVGGRR